MVTLEPGLLLGGIQQSIVGSGFVPLKVGWDDSVQLNIFDQCRSCNITLYCATGWQKLMLVWGNESLDS